MCFQSITVRNELHRELAESNPELKLPNLLLTASARVQWVDKACILLFLPLSHHPCRLCDVVQPKPGKSLHISIWRLNSVLLHFCLVSRTASVLSLSVGFLKISQDTIPISKEMSVTDNIKYVPRIKSFGAHSSSRPQSSLDKWGCCHWKSWTLCAGQSLRITCSPPLCHLGVHSR